MFTLFSSCGVHLHFKWKKKLPSVLTLCSMRSVCLFSMLFFEHFSWYWQENLYIKQKLCFVGDHFLYSSDLNVLFSNNTVRRCLMLDTPILEVKGQNNLELRAERTAILSAAIFLSIQCVYYYFSWVSPYSSSK